MTGILTKKFNRHIGRILGYLDDAGVNEATKKRVRDEVWLLHDDIDEVGITLKDTGNK